MTYFVISEVRRVITLYSRLEPGSVAWVTQKSLNCWNASISSLRVLLLSLTGEQLGPFRGILVTSSVPIREPLLISH
jgi:hypothetical protein